MTCPRVLTLAGDRLHQEPVPELVALRTGESCREVELELPEQQAVPLTQVRGRQGHMAACGAGMQRRVSCWSRRRCR
jgi:hypothetical protein